MSQGISPRRPTLYYLDVHPLGGLLERQRHLFSESQLRIGRAKENDLCLHSVHCLVSRYHLTLYQAAGRFWIIDGGSRNGTLHNGEPVPKAVAVPLADADKLQVGEFQITFSQVSRS